MTIRNEIDFELWESIQKNYESENYTGAIIDAIFKLTDTIRNKTGLECDGANLIGQAFGGEDPQIKLNKLQTNSEKDIQKGIQEILRGIYTGIRNPRSHDAMIDDQVSADAIIIFINYLLKLIDHSKLRFNEEYFLKRVFDPYYVNTKEYSILLINEIPIRQKANIAIQTLLRRENGNIYSLGYFLSALFDQLESSELSRVYKVISDELKTTTEESDIRYLIHICPAKYWSKIDTAVRVRTESILFSDFSKGTYNETIQRCGDFGSLATWITATHLENFENHEKWTHQAVKMLESNNIESIAYINKFFWDIICHINKDNISFFLKQYIKNGLKENDQHIISKLEKQIIWDSNHPWWNIFEEEFKSHPEITPIELPF